MDALVAILTNPITLAVLGFAMARYPGLRTVIANRYIPIIQTIIAWLVSIVGPAVANAAVGAPAASVAVLGGFTFFSGIGGTVGGFLNGVAGAAWQTAQAHILYRLFLHKTLGPDPKDSLK